MRYALSICNVMQNYSTSILLERLGSYFQTTGDLEQAKKMYERYSDVMQKLHKDYPDDEDYKNGLAISYSKLGDTHASLGDLDKALQYFEDDLKLTKELYEADKKNVGFKNGLAISYYKLGDFHRDQRKDAETAKTYFQQSQQLWEELTTLAPNYAEFKKNLETVKSILASLNAKPKKRWGLF
jgi:tetratricopeptide (TPR) repeat protein